MTNKESFGMFAVLAAFLAALFVAALIFNRLYGTPRVSWASREQRIVETEGYLYRLVPIDQKEEEQ